MLEIFVLGSATMHAPTISVVSHVVGRPQRDVVDFRNSFSGSPIAPLEVLIAEGDVWDKCSMMNAAAAKSKGAWLLVTDIDNRFDATVLSDLTLAIDKGCEAVFLKNVTEIRSGNATNDPEGKSKRQWAYTAALVSAPLWRAIGGFDVRYRKWGWMDLDLFQACQARAKVVVDEQIPVLSLWHPTWKIWAFSQLGELQCYIDQKMFEHDMWLYRMTLPSSALLVEEWSRTASPFLREVYNCWKSNRLLYEAKWPIERDRIREKYKALLNVDIY